MARTEGPWWFGTFATVALVAASLLMYHGARTYRIGLALGIATCLAVLWEFWRGRHKT
jgi:hypothetical protein